MPCVNDVAQMSFLSSVFWKLLNICRFQHARHTALGLKNDHFNLNKYEINGRNSYCKCLEFARVTHLIKFHTCLLMCVIFSRMHHVLISSVKTTHQTI